MTTRIVGLCAVVLALCVCGAPAARAEVDVRTLLDLYEKSAGDAALRDQVELTVSMMETGMGWANAELTQIRKDAAIYCPPRQMAFTGTQLIDILRRAADKKPILAKQPFGLALLVSLKEVFPCR